jgi:hypothetical protein
MEQLRRVDPTDMGRCLQTEIIHWDQKECVVELGTVTKTEGRLQNSVDTCHDVMISRSQSHIVINETLFELHSTLLKHQPSSPSCPSLFSAFSLCTVILLSSLGWSAYTKYVYLVLLPHHNLQAHFVFSEHFLDCRCFLQFSTRI